MSDPVTYTAVLSVAEETVPLVSRLLAAERRRRGTRGLQPRDTTNGRPIEAREFANVAGCGSRARRCQSHTGGAGIGAWRGHHGQRDDEGQQGGGDAEEDGGRWPAVSGEDASSASLVGARGWMSMCWPQTVQVPVQVDTPSSAVAVWGEGRWVATGPARRPGPGAGPRRRSCVRPTQVLHTAHACSSSGKASTGRHPLSDGRGNTSLAAPDPAAARHGHRDVTGPTGAAASSRCNRSTGPRHGQDEFGSDTSWCGASERQTVSLDDALRPVGVGVALVWGGHPGELLRRRWLGEAAEPAEELLEPRGGDELEHHGRLVSCVQKVCHWFRGSMTRSPSSATTSSFPSTAPMRLVRTKVYSSSR